MPPDTPNVITAGNVFHNAADRLGEIPPATVQAQMRCKLIRVPFSEMLVLARIPAVGGRLRLPPIISILKQVDAFHDLNKQESLSAEQYQALASITAWEHFPASQTVSQQGVRDNSLRILQRGAAIVRATDADGKERPRAFMAPGRFYGQSSLFRQERHETTVRAVRPFFALRIHFGPSLIRRMASLSHLLQSDFIILKFTGSPFLFTSNDTCTSPVITGLDLYSSGS